MTIPPPDTDGGDDAMAPRWLKVVGVIVLIVVLVVVVILLAGGGFGGDLGGHRPPEGGH